MTFVFFKIDLGGAPRGLEGLRWCARVPEPYKTRRGVVLKVAYTTKPAQNVKILIFHGSLFCSF